MGGATHEHGAWAIDICAWHGAWAIRYVRGCENYSKKPPPHAVWGSYSSPRSENDALGGPGRGQAELLRGEIEQLSHSCGQRRLLAHGGTDPAQRGTRVGMASAGSAKNKRRISFSESEA